MFVGKKDVDKNQLLKTKGPTLSVVVHAGAGPDSEYVQKNQEAYRQGLESARDKAYAILSKKGSALDAVEAAVKELEDNPIFNAGRGSALTNVGDIQMYASIMEGADLKAGAACLLSRVKNPIVFARSILEQGESVFIGGEEAERLATELGIPQEPLAYFVTDLQVKNFLVEREKWRLQNDYNPAIRGTVGCVAFDCEGNLAAGTSTGGTMYSQSGRIGDTSMLGVGTYADNRVCAVSCTGDGEALIKHVIAHSVFSIREFLKDDMQSACNYLFEGTLKNEIRDVGCIAIDKNGVIGIACNTPRMHRAWRTNSDSGVAIYETEPGPNRP